MKIKRLNRFITIVIVIFTVLSIIIYPGASLKAAKYGINLWLFTLFPALLPFFIGSELLLGLGVVKLLGNLLEPIMRPIFKVPGAGSFAMAVGYTSGYPVGAQIIARLWEERMVNTLEAEKLMAFCNNSGPLFMLGVVAMGMFNNSKIGYIIMASNYIGAIITGLLFRFHNKSHNDNILINKSKKNLEVHNDSFGNMLGKAVISSMNTMLLIGGYIIIFSVLIEFLKIYGIINIIGKLISPIFIFLRFNKNIIPGYVSGLFEITIGSNMISQSNVPINEKIILISSILAWGGFSTHGQVLGVINKTSIKYLPYLLAKFIHSILTAFSAFILCNLIKIELPTSKFVFNQGNINSFFNLVQLSAYIFIITIIIYFLFTFIYLIINKGV